MLHDFIVISEPFKNIKINKTAFTLNKVIAVFCYPTIFISIKKGQIRKYYGPDKF